MQQHVHIMRPLPWNFLQIVLSMKLTWGRVTVVVAALVPQMCQPCLSFYDHRRPGQCEIETHTILLESSCAYAPMVSVPRFKFKIKHIEEPTKYERLIRFCLSPFMHTNSFDT